MVASICSIVILYMVAEQRLNELPAAAERANFHGVLEQIKSGVHLTMMAKVAGGKMGEIIALEGANPMNLLLEVPSNYMGELEYVTDAVANRNAWYFETATGELVYVVGGQSIEDVWVTIATIPVNLGQIRLRITNVFGAQGGGGGGLDAWEGLSLRPVHDFRWERREERPIELTQE